MPIVNIEDIQPGMLLAEAVRNHQDQLLLDSGRRITEKSIRVFKSWGIRRIHVKPGSPLDASDEGAASTDQEPPIDEALKARFSDVSADPLMLAIMQAAARQLAARQPKKKIGHGRR
jgi:hypothetical protein